MSSYQIQFFDARGRMAHSKAMECHSDDDALERLARLPHRHAIELWAAGGLVWRFEPMTAERVALVRTARR